MANLDLLGLAPSQRNLIPRKPLFLALLAGTTFILYLFTSRWGVYDLRAIKKYTSPHKSAPTCTAAAWSAGYWKHAPRSIPNIGQLKEPLSMHQVLQLSGYSGCASAQANNVMLGMAPAGTSLGVVNSSSYQWIPGDGCDASVLNIQPQRLIQHLVTNGAWLILGDSLSLNQYSSLSCILYPHIYEERHVDPQMPRRLMLSNTSSFFKDLVLPQDFDVATTPLVQFQRNDYLFNRSELAVLFNNFYPFNLNGSIHSPEASGTELSFEYYLPMFANGRFSTLITSTALHWSIRTFHSFREGANPGKGVPKLLEFFEHVAKNWTIRAQEQIKNTAKSIIIKDVLPGHSGCHTLPEMKQPWTTYDSSSASEHNWGFIHSFNDVLRAAVQDRQKFPNLHFLDIGRPGLLRPDAHVHTLNDCLHLLVGSGVTEGWNEYMTHYLLNVIGPRN